MSDLSQKDASLSEVMRSIINTVVLEMYFCLPAKIEFYDPLTQYADVQVQLLEGYNDGSTSPIPVIPNVPVKHPRANDGAAFIHMPLKPGDDCILVFSQRSLDNWKTQGGMTDPADNRKCHLSDAFALIGGSAFPDAFAPTTTDSIEIVNGQTSVIVHPDGKFEAKNSTAELIDLIDQITEQISITNETLSEDTVNTVFGPQKLLNFETYANIHTQLESLKTMLDSFKV